MATPSALMRKPLNGVVPPRVRVMPPPGALEGCMHGAIVCGAGEAH